MKLREQNSPTQGCLFPFRYRLHLSFLVFELFQFESGQIKMGHPVDIKKYYLSFSKRKFVKKPLTV